MGIFGRGEQKGLEDVPTFGWVDGQARVAVRLPSERAAMDHLQRVNGVLKEAGFDGLVPEVGYGGQMRLEGQQDNAYTGKWMLILPTNGEQKKAYLDIVASQMSLTALPTKEDLAAMKDALADMQKRLAQSEERMAVRDELTRQRFITAGEVMAAAQADREAAAVDRAELARVLGETQVLQAEAAQVLTGAKAAAREMLKEVEEARRRAVQAVGDKGTAVVEMIEVKAEAALGRVGELSAGELEALEEILGDRGPAQGIEIEKIEKV